MLREVAFTLLWTALSQRGDRQNGNAVKNDWIVLCKVSYRQIEQQLSRRSTIDTSERCGAIGLQELLQKSHVVTRQLVWGCRVHKSVNRVMICIVPNFDHLLHGCHDQKPCLSNFSARLESGYRNIPVHPTVVSRESKL